MNIIDLTYFVQKNSSSFWGAPIFATNGTDFTFSYGVIRDLLRIRQRFGIIKWIFVLGRDSLDYISEQNINTICNLFEHIGFPLILDSKNTTLSICSKFENGDKDDIVVITSNSNILQLIDHYSHIILLQNDDHSVITTPDDVKKKIGVTYKNIATYNALTYCDGTRKQLFTKKQAARLIEIYGDIYQIFNTLSNIPTSIRNKLSSDKEAIFELYNRNTIQKIDEISLPIARPIQKDKCVPIFEKLEFFSLTRLLDAPLEFNINKASQKISNYRPILDKENLTKLESRILSFRICSFDTESDGVNPKRATILGISFSVQEGTAYYLPLIDNDLKDITLDDVIKTLNKIFNSGLTFVGHNLKYDILLLQTYGFIITGQYFDTMLAAQDCFCDWEFFNLGYISKKLLNKEIKSYKNIVKGNQTFLDLPFKEIVKHGCEDADITLRLYKVLMRELDSKNILDWYYQQTIPQMLRLIKYEYNGLNIRSNKLSSLRDSQLNEIILLKKKIHGEVKFQFDLDSSNDLANVLNNTLNLKELVRNRKINSTLLEQLATSNHIVKLIVFYKRMRKELASIETILRAIKNEKIFPIFKQNSQYHNCISSTNPNLFKFSESTIFKLAQCFPTDFACFKNAKKSVDNLQKISGDKVLFQDRSAGPGINSFINTQLISSKTDADVFLLSIVTGGSNHKLSKEFLTDRLSISTVRHNIETRYCKLFSWLDEFNTLALYQGYITKEGNKQYFDGLNSSSLGKRKKSLNKALKCLIGY